MDLIETGLNDPIKHWYYSHKFWFIRNSKIWEHPQILLADVGAGSALFSKELLKLGLVSKVFAVDSNYPDNMKSETFGISYSRKADYSKCTHFLLTDVLEHIEDDFLFLKSVTSEAKSGSNFIITVPALMNLWSGHDIYLKHFRRYTLNQLLTLVQTSGIKVTTIRYTFSTVYPLAWIQRKTRKAKFESSQLKIDNKLISGLLRFLLFFDRKLSFLPFGVSLFLVGTKY